MNDHLESALSHLELAASNIRAAHQVACEQNPLAQIVLLPMIGEIAGLRNRVKEIVEAVSTARGT